MAWEALGLPPFSLLEPLSLPLNFHQDHTHIPLPFFFESLKDKTTLLFKKVLPEGWLIHQNFTCLFRCLWSKDTSGCL